MEALRVQVDQLKWENHQLQAENQKLYETMRSKLHRLTSRAGARDK